jgi:adenosylcobinamide-GDP ribazoletransferase
VTDGLRLAVGTLTVLRVPAPRRVDRRTAATALVLAPLVGLVLGAVAELAVLVVRWSVDGWADRAVAAVVAVGVLALLTRGLHLDGLADTADALGSGLTGEAGLAVMRRSDVGPFGVVTLVLVLLLEVSGLVVAILDGRGTLALVGGTVVARLALTWTGRAGVPAARPDGLGAALAGSVPVPLLVAVSAASFAALAALTVADDDLTRAFVPQTLLAAVAALTVSQLLVRRAVGRFGGVTGDVMGAAAEVAFCVFVLGVAVR